MKYERHRKYTINGRFALDPSQTAMENLSRAISLAAFLVMTRKYNTAGYDTQTLKEIREEIELNATVHFLAYKVRQHKYNRNYDFLTNCISSCWTVASGVFERMNRRIENRHVTYSMNRILYRHHDFFDAMEYRDGIFENNSYPEKFTPTRRMAADRRRPGHAMKKLVEEYNDYQLDCVLLGGIRPVTLDEWIDKNATDDEKRAWDWHRSGKDAVSVHRREWMRDYQKRRREKMRAERLAEYERWRTDPEYDGKEGRK